MRVTLDSRGEIGRRTYRSIGTTRCCIYGILATAGFAVLAVASSQSRATGLFMSPVCLILTWRIWLLGIHVDSRGIQVVGFLFSKRYAWEEIDHFAVLPLGTSPWAGHVILRDGSKTGTFGIGAAGRPRWRAETLRRQVQEPIDDLNALLEQRQRGAVST